MLSKKGIRIFSIYFTLKYMENIKAELIRAVDDRLFTDRFGKRLNNLILEARTGKDNELTRYTVKNDSSIICLRGIWSGVEASPKKAIQAFQDAEIETFRQLEYLTGSHNMWALRRINTAAETLLEQIPMKWGEWYEMDN